MRPLAAPRSSRALPPALVLTLLFTCGSALAPDAAAEEAGTRAQVAGAAKTTRRLVAAEVAELARTAAAAGGVRLPRGASIESARLAPGAAPEVPIAPARTVLDVTPPPRRAGTVRAAAVLVFFDRKGDVAARVPVTLELTVPPEALIHDVAKGSTLTLVVRRGLVEIATSAVASSDADVGDVIQVLVRPSGRAMRATILSRDRAVAVETGR